jgi:hypothetical protein
LPTLAVSRFERIEVGDLPVAPGPTIRRFTYAFIGVALGGLGIGWHGQPADAVIAGAIRARDPLHLVRAHIALVDVQRDWFHEVYGLWDSHFMVRATIARDGEPTLESCFEIVPGAAGTAMAFGPYESWRCHYPFLG